MTRRAGLPQGVRLQPTESLTMQGTTKRGESIRHLGQ